MTEIKEKEPFEFTKNNELQLSSYIHFDTGKTIRQCAKWRYSFKERRILWGVRFYPKEHSVAICAGAIKNYYVDVSEIIENIRVTKCMFIRKNFDTKEECRDFLYYLKKKYGKKHSKFIIKDDKLGILKEGVLNHEINNR